MIMSKSRGRDYRWLRPLRLRLSLAQAQVEHLYAYREGHREVHVALGHVVEPVDVSATQQTAACFRHAAGLRAVMAHEVDCMYPLPLCRWRDSKKR
jgi:hypothetical protein